MNDLDNSFDLTPQTTDTQKGIRLGLRMAADFLSNYDYMSSHRFKLGDCLLFKFGLIEKSEMRHNRDVNVDHIVRVVARETGAPANSILGKNRMALIVRSRHLCIWLASTVLQLTPAEIARAFSMDHSSILHATRRGRILYQGGSKPWKAMVSKIIKELDA